MGTYKFFIRGQVMADGFVSLEADSQAEANMKFAELEPEVIEWEYGPDFQCGAVVIGVTVDGGTLSPLNWQATPAGFWYAEDVNKLQAAPSND